MILPVPGAAPTLECTWQEDRPAKLAGNQTTPSQPQQIFISTAELIFTELKRQQLIFLMLLLTCFFYPIFGVVLGLIDFRN